MRQVRTTHHRLTQRFSAVFAAAIVLTQWMAAPLAEASLWAERRSALPASRPSAVQPLFSAPLAAVPATPFSAIPATLGSVRRVQTAHGDARGGAKGAVLLVQDVHLHAEAQSKISSALAAVADRVSFVGVEAAFAPIATAPYAAFPHRDSVRRAADYLLSRNRISGAVHAALLFPLTLAGVDDESLYRTNVAALTVGDKARAEALARWNADEASLAAEKAKTWNGALRAFDGRVRSYRDGSTALTAHAAYLARTLNETPASFDSFLTAAALEGTLNFDRVEAERRRFAEILARKLNDADAARLAQAAVRHRLGGLSPLAFNQFLVSLGHPAGIDVAAYPALSAYLRYLEAADRVRPEAVLADAGRLEETGYERLSRTDSERALARRVQRHDLARRLLDNAMGAGDWDRYVALGGGADDALRPFETFYRTALLRDDAMAERIAGRLANGGSAALVLGGFHATGVGERLAKAGFDVYAFTPSISSADGDRAQYLSAFLSERTPLEKLFETPRLTLAPAPMPRAVAQAELPALVIAGEARNGRAAGDVTDVLRRLSPESPVTARVDSASPVTETLSLGGRTFTFGVRHDGNGDVSGETFAPAPLTGSLIANLFSGHLNWNGRLEFLNVVLRVLFAPAIVPHEIGHLLAGPESGKRMAHGARRLINGLFYGMPWSTRGPTAVAGLAANLAVLTVLMGASWMIVDLQGSWAGIAVLSLTTLNIVFLLGEIVLTPLAARLGIPFAPDLRVLQNGEVLRYIRPARANLAPKHRRPPDFYGVPLWHFDAVRDVTRTILKRRPIAGDLRFVQAIPAPRPTDVRMETEMSAWQSDGTIFIRTALLEWAESPAGLNAMPTVPSGEDRVGRAVLIATLQAATQLHLWNRFVGHATQNDFDSWRREAVARFPFSSTVPMNDLLDDYERMFESPNLMSVEKIRWAGGVLGLSSTEIRQSVEPDWVYRFEIPVKMDDGRVEFFTGWRVHHNDAQGQNKGGFRYKPNLDADTAIDLSREMSIKNSVVHLPLGGGKGGVRIDRRSISKRELAALTRGYVTALHNFGAIGPETDVPAPDMDTDAEVMSWFADEYIRREVVAGRIAHLDLTMINPSNFTDTDTPFLDAYVRAWNAGQVDGHALAVVTGKPVEKGGIIGRTEATAQGLFYVTVEAVRHYLNRPDLRNATVAIQGFGNVGYNTAKIFVDNGARIVAVSDVRGSVIAPEGVDIAALKAHLDSRKDLPFNQQLIGFSQPGATVKIGDTAGTDALFAPAEIVIPAATEKQIKEDNAGRIDPSVKLIIEGANGPITPAGEAVIRRERPGVVVIPDVLSNAGGVTVSHFEWQRNMGQLPRDVTVETVNELLRDIMVPAARELFRVADAKRVQPREATYLVAVPRIQSQSGPRLFSSISRLFASRGTSHGLMPWLFGPAIRWAGNASGRLAVVTGLGGIVEEVAVRAAVQTLLAAAFSAVLPAAGPAAAIAIYAILFATVLHPTVIDAAGRDVHPSASNRAALFGAALLLGVAAAAIPGHPAFGFIAIGLAHGAANAALSLRGGPEARAARAVIRWMESDRTSRAARVAAELLSTDGAADLNQDIRGLDGRLTAHGARFDQALFERELARRILDSRVLSRTTVNELSRSLGRAIRLDADAVAAHPSSLSERRLTTAVLDDRMDPAATRRVLDALLKDHDAAPDGRLVVIAKGEAAVVALAALKGRPNTLLVTESVTVGDVLSLARVEEVLSRANAFDGIRAVRLAVAGDFRIDTDGLSADARLREALVWVIDSALKAAALTVQRLETIDRVIRTVASQA